MKLFLLICLFFGFSLNIFSQDLIVTNVGDSINCKITRISLDDIRYMVKENNRLKRKTILKTEVSSSVPNYFENAMPDEEKIDLRNEIPRSRLAVSGGFGYLTAGVNKNDQQFVQDYYKNLKSGYQFGAEYTYFINESLGIGAKFNSFNTNAVLGNVTFMDTDSTTVTGMVSDDITVIFIGPSLTSRNLSFDDRHAFISTISLGYLGYNNDALFIDKLNLKGGTFGIAGSLGYDYGIGNNLMLGIEAGFYTGVLRKVEISDGVNSQTLKLEPGEYESLSRIDLSIGFRMSF